VRRRIDPADPFVVRGPHSPGSGSGLPFLPAAPALAPERRLGIVGRGPVCEWLFAKGGISAVLMLALMGLPVLAALPVGRGALASTRAAKPGFKTPHSFGRSAEGVRGPVDRVTGIAARQP
jgi:hypothetical protein